MRKSLTRNRPSSSISVSSLPFFLLSAFSFLLLPSPASLTAVNVSIDDTYGDPYTGVQISYEPGPAWQAGQTCTNCTAKVDASQTYMQSWHDATYNPPGGGSNDYPGQVINATVQFTGTAVYVYCILTGSNTSPDGDTDMAFYIDDSSNPVGTIERQPDGDGSFQYNQLVFSQTGLDGSKSHEIRLQSGNAGNQALVLLDRIVYTTDDSDITTTLYTVSATPSSSPSSSDTSASSSSSSTANTTSSDAATSTSGFSTLTTVDGNTVSLPTLTVSPFPSPSSSFSSGSNSKHNTGTIVGATIGSVGGLGAAVLLLWLCAARRRRVEREEDEAARAVQPFFPPRSRADAFGSVDGLGAGNGGAPGGEGSGSFRASGGKESAFRGSTYLSLPSFPMFSIGGGGKSCGPISGSGTGTKTTGGTTLTSPLTTSTSFKPSNYNSTNAPVTTYTPVPYTLPPPRTKYEAAGLAVVGGEGERPYLANVRSEKMRPQLGRQEQNQAAPAAVDRRKTKTRRKMKPNSNTNSRSKTAKVSPFSPTPLYTPGGEGESEILSPSTVTATISSTARESTVQPQTIVDGSSSALGGNSGKKGSEEDGDTSAGVRTEGNEEKFRRGRTWNSSDRTRPVFESRVLDIGVLPYDGHELEHGQSGGQGEDSTVATTSSEKITSFTFLRPNRRREPAPLDDSPLPPSFIPAPELTVPAVDERMKRWKSTGVKMNTDIDIGGAGAIPTALTVLRPNRRPEQDSVTSGIPPQDDGLGRQNLYSPQPQSQPPSPSSHYSTSPTTSRPYPHSHSHSQHKAPVPPRPKRSRSRPLTRISERNGNLEDDDDVGTGMNEGVITNRGENESDEGSDVRWQRKLVNMFTPSASTIGAVVGGREATGTGRKGEGGGGGGRGMRRRSRSLPTPP